MYIYYDYSECLDTSKSKKELESEYNELYARISAVTENLNLCKFDKKHTCKRARIWKSTHHYCCCNGGDFFDRDVKHCPNFVEGKGCGIKSISCKLWFCDDVDVPIEIETKLRKLKEEAKKKGFYYPRRGFEDSWNRFLEVDEYMQQNKLTDRMKEVIKDTKKVSSDKIEELEKTFHLHNGIGKQPCRCKDCVEYRRIYLER